MVLWRQLCVYGWFYVIRARLHVYNKPMKNEKKKHSITEQCFHFNVAKTSLFLCVCLNGRYVALNFILFCSCRKYSIRLTFLKKKKFYSQCQTGETIAYIQLIRQTKKLLTYVVIFIQIVRFMWLHHHHPCSNSLSVIFFYCNVCITFRSKLK